MTTNTELQAEMRENRRLLYIHYGFISFHIYVILGIIAAIVNIWIAFLFLAMAIISFLAAYGKVLVMDETVPNKYFNWIPFWNEPAKRMGDVMDKIVMEERE